MTAAKKKQQAESVELFDVAQGSDEWFDLRLGMPTASEFSTVMASGRGEGDSIGRRKLMYRLAGEVLTGSPGETYQNAAMLRGKEMEPQACAHYAFTRGVELDQVGFALRTLPNGLKVGGSPDRLVGERGVLETKTMRPDLLIELGLRGAAGFPTEHRAQCQGLLWVLGRQWCDCMFFYERMPFAPCFRFERDEVYIRQISDAVEVFDWELKQLVAKIRKMGG